MAPLPILFEDLVSDDMHQALHSYPLRVHLVCQWIERYIVRWVQTGVLSIPSPMLTRCWQELGGGLTHFHEALVLTEVQFPFVFVQVCDYLLVLHACLAPVVIPTWCIGANLSFWFTFVQLLTFWSMHIACFHLENPFEAATEEDLPLPILQTMMNSRLAMLLGPEAAIDPELPDEPRLPATQQDGEEPDLEPHCCARSWRSARAASQPPPRFVTLDTHVTQRQAEGRADHRQSVTKVTV